MTHDLRPDEIAQRSSAVRLEGCYVNLGRDFISPRANLLLDYWDRKRGDRDVPDWRDIELMDLWPVASRFMVKDRVGDDEWRNRYYGSHLASRLGRDATGLRVCDYHPEQRVADILLGYAMMVQGRGPLRALGFFVQAKREHVPYEGIYLPLTSGGDRIEKMIAMPDYDYRLPMQEAS